MNSAAHRSVTVVTIVTLIFTPMLTHGNWVNVLTGTTEETQIVHCQPDDPCPAEEHVTRSIVLPQQQP
jgi:hypothetical protein